MDGNGRWAESRGLVRALPAIALGAKTRFDGVVEAVLGPSACEALTLYSFSSENWKRPADEVAALMELCAPVHLQLAAARRCSRNNIRFRRDRAPRRHARAGAGRLGSHGGTGHCPLHRLDPVLWP
jgi:undecaprenyl diphosphate synthase